MVRNARALAAFIAPARCAFVVKSNGYGHGLVQTARALEQQTDRLCVYAIEEALALRAAGVRTRIFVMGPVPGESLDDVVASDIEIALWDTGSYLRTVGDAARKRGARCAVHVKLNTGVARLGLEPRRALEAFAAYACEPAVRIAGVFSHLAAAEELDSPFTLAQLERLETALAVVQPGLARAGIRPQRHIAASAAAILWPQTRLDFARIGIAVYGLWPSAGTREAAAGSRLHLEPALTFTSQIVAVRGVSAGTPIGYGTSYHAPKDTRIGVVPLGYADGIPRLLSNRGAFLVAGARCPIVGRVCMNMTMIDLESAPVAATGSPVTLIGREGQQSVGADDWAGWAETINYEIVARLPEHLPREMRSSV